MGSFKFMNQKLLWTHFIFISKFSMLKSYPFPLKVFFLENLYFLLSFHSISKVSCRVSMLVKIMVSIQSWTRSYLVTLILMKSSHFMQKKYTKTKQHIFKRSKNKTNNAYTMPSKLNGLMIWSVYQILRFLLVHFFYL